MENYIKIKNYISNIEKYKIVDKEESFINYKLLSEDIDNVNKDLIISLLNDSLCKEIFFNKINDVFVFNQKTMIDIMFNQNEYLDGSLTKYDNKIGLFVKDINTVQLNFPYKDCVLVGGMDKEDDKINSEIFYNESIDKNKINKLFEPKIFHNIEKFSFDSNLKQDEQLDNPNNIQTDTNIDEIKFETIIDENGIEKKILKDNLLIKGNNLLGLHSLSKRLSNYINVIYIDPPYYFNQTKASDSFAYNSNFKLSTWLTFMKNRLEIAKELLADDGVIFISTHDIGSSHLKLLCDDIFGFDNYIEQLSIENNPKGRKNSSFFSKNGEYCFVYAKNKSIINEFKEVFKKENILKDENGNFYTNGQRILVGESSNKKLIDFRSKKNYIIYYNKKNNSIEIYIPENHLDKKEIINSNIVEYISKKDGFLLENTYTIDKFMDLFNQKSIIFKENTIYEKDRNIFKRAKSIIVDNNDFDLKTESATKILSNLKIDFPMSKSHKFIEMLIKMSSYSNAIILDFFAGSGTTGQAVMDLNKEDGGTRKFILLEQMDYIKNITCERLKRSMIKENYEDSFIYMEMFESETKLLRNQIKSINSIDNLKLLIDIYFNYGYFININDKQDLLNKLDLLYSKKQDLNLVLKTLIEKYMENNIDYNSFEDIEEHKSNLKENEYQLNKSFYGDSK